MQVGRLIVQKPDDKNKLHALHTPEVECVGKGKARSKYEFGVKYTLAVTNALARRRPVRRRRQDDHRQPVGRQYVGHPDRLAVEAMKVVHPGLVCEAGVAKHQPRPERPDERS